MSIANGYSKPYHVMSVMALNAMKILVTVNIENIQPMTQYTSIN